MDLLDALTLLLAIAGVVLAGVALALVVRGPGGADPVGDARRAGLERRVAHLVQRLEALEGADASRARSVPLDSRTVAGTVEAGADRALTRVGLVRFDAFEDAGGAQSFSLALLDASADGVLLTSLHSRQVTRLYVKSIHAGRSDLPLSGEERAALREAGIAT